VEGFTRFLDRSGGFGSPLRRHIHKGYYDSICTRANPTINPPAKSIKALKNSKKGHNMTVLRVLRFIRRVSKIALEDLIYIYDAGKHSEKDKSPE
jgi:hypothetical protein